jgi:hypothetical protein
MATPPALTKEERFILRKLASDGQQPEASSDLAEA